jgi:hypothetical protein
MKNRMKTGRKSASKVCTKSRAQVAWLRRKVLRRWPPPGSRPFTYRCTVRFDTRIPSLSSSPRIRSAPQRGFRAAISPMSAARLVGLRPRGRDRQRYRSRKPSRCHRSTVAGCTSATAVRHAVVHLVSTAMVRRCEPVNITRLPCSRHFAAASCCWRSSFSAASDARERKSPTTNPTRATSICGKVPAGGSSWSQAADQISSQHGYSWPLQSGTRGAPRGPGAVRGHTSTVGREPPGTAESRVDSVQPCSHGPHFVADANLSVFKHVGPQASAV